MTIKTYQQYLRIRRTIPFKGTYVPYDWGELPQTIHMTWMAYSQMFDEFSRELSNAHNALVRYTHQLTAWRDLLAPMGLQQQLDAAVEFVDPLATVALNLPYVIRSRFIFASAHLCHQANRAKQIPGWKDEFPLDDGVWFETADLYGKGWKRYGAFKARLARVGAKDYQAGTHDFRNAYNHRFSPRIVLGISNIVRRREDKTSGAVSYGFGETPALTLPLVATLLADQCQRSLLAFEGFQKLIREHEAVIGVHNTASLSVVDRRSSKPV